MEAPSARREERVCATCAYSTSESGDALFCPEDGGPLVRPQQLRTRSETDPYLGHVIAGMIEIRSLIGIGAMGRVYRAFQRGIDRQVAVKILHKELATNKDLVTRFLREAKVASRLEHPGVVQILLSGQLEDGSLYIAMEYLDGLSLQSALAAAGGRLPLVRALRIMIQLADAVGEAHAQGVVHRDMKPENVMLVRRGENADFVKVLDFGIARVQSGDPTVATSAGLIFGTARYISPEGAQGERVGPAGDVYSLATMLYQMLGGRSPFDGEQAVTMLLKQVQEPPPELRSIPAASEVPEPIARVVMQNLAKAPTDRDPDARAFAHKLIAAAARAQLPLDDVLRPSRPSRPSDSPISASAPPGNETRDWRPPNLEERIAEEKSRETERQMEPHPPSREAGRTLAIQGTTGTAMLSHSPVPPLAKTEPHEAPRESSRPTRTEYAVPPNAATVGYGAPYGGAAPPPAAHPASIRPAPPAEDRRAAPAWVWVIACFGIGAMLTGAGLHFFQSTSRTTTTPWVLPSSTAGTHQEATAARSAVPTATMEIPALQDTASASPSSSATTRVQNALRARPQLAVTPEQASIGQTVRFVGTVAGASQVAGAEFTIRGSTMPNGVRITATPEGTAYHAEYTFLEGGRFDVTFAAKVDGADSRASRVIQVGSVPTLPSAKPSSLPGLTPSQAPLPTPLLPAPSTSVRWM